jgi:3-hydroxybutyryl-CoA dehydrogenase
MEIKRVLVLGAGTMGVGIAQVAAEKGFEVILRDLDFKIVERGIETIRKNLVKSVQKGKLSDEEVELILSRIKGVDDIIEGQDVDIAIEAVVEDMDVKKEILRNWSVYLQEEAILATNTSALSITELASATSRPDKVIGLHFFNPVPVMESVEVTKGETTSRETFEAALNFVRALSKTPIKVSEAPGFITNRILIPMINEAAFALMEGVASAKDIDNAMMLGANHPIGPLALGDLIGLDVCLAIMETLQREFGDPKYRPCPLLRKKVRAGYLGRKTGRGFYEYN